MKGKIKNNKDIEKEIFLDTVSSWKPILDKENSTILQNHPEIKDILTLQNMKHNVLGMSPKKIGIFLENVILHHYGMEFPEIIGGEIDGILNGDSIEIKTSRVIHTKNGDFDSQFEFLLNYERVLLSLNDLLDKKFDCNMQQVKPKLFDKIFYGMLVEEGLVIFSMNKDTLLQNSKQLAYSDKQHRGNVGEGQFHIKNSNVVYHFNNYLEKMISWNEIFTVLKTFK